MQKIKLKKRAWFVNTDKPLGKPGGFGEVFEGTDGEGTELAVKRFFQEAEESANREINIAESLIGFSHSCVIPILDCGRDPDSGRIFIVMPRATESLSHYLECCTSIQTA